MTVAVRVLVVDDHPVVREGLRHLFEAGPRRWSVVEADSGFAALEQMRASRFDIAVVDLSMEGMSGLQLVRRTHGEFPYLPILVLSLHPEDQYALRAFHAGASGYLGKSASTATLVGAVEKLALGGTHMSEHMTGLFIKTLNTGVAGAVETLTDREHQVLSMIVGGQRLTEIALALNLSAKTVSTHKARLQAKLKVANTAELIRYGVEQGISPRDAD